MLFDTGTVSKKRDKSRDIKIVGRISILLSSVVYIQIAEQNRAKIANKTN